MLQKAADVEGGGKKLCLPRSLGFQIALQPDQELDDFATRPRTGVRMGEI